MIVMFGGGVYPMTYFDDTWILEVGALPTVPRHLRLPSSLPSDYNNNNDINNSNSPTSMFGYFHSIWEDALHKMGQPKHRVGSLPPVDGTGAMGKSPGAVASSSSDRRLSVDGKACECLVRQRFADVCFELDCGGRVQAHRLVLAARCLYFRSLLDGMLIFKYPNSIAPIFIFSPYLNPINIYFSSLLTPLTYNDRRVRRWSQGIW